MSLSRWTLPIAFSVSCLAFAACGSKSNDAPNPPPPAPVENFGKAEPVEMSVPLDGQAYARTVSIQLNQAQSWADYYLTQSSDTDVQINGSSAVTEGCDVNQVHIEHAWFESAGQTVGLKVKLGESFHAKAGMRGHLQVQFLNLTGCTRITHTLVLGRLKTSLPLGMAEENP